MEIVFLALFIFSWHTNLWLDHRIITPHNVALHTCIRNCITDLHLIEISQCYLGISSIRWYTTDYKNIDKSTDKEK